MTDEEKKPYHTIMTAAWRLFGKERSAEKFSDAWWQEIISEYDDLRKPYKGTIYDDYCGDISQAFLEQWERIQKSDRQKRVFPSVLPEKQGYHQEELSFKNPVPKVGGSEEDTVPLELKTGAQSPSSTK